MKQFTAIILSFVLCMPILLKLGVLVWYFSQKDYIATELCENRDRPELGCEGQCVLGKALQQVDCCAVDSTNTDQASSESKPLNTRKAVPEYPDISPYLSVELPYAISYGVEEIFRQSVLGSQHCIDRLFDTSVFKPPEFLS